jgi:hypothetical protein
MTTPSFEDFRRSLSRIGDAPAAPSPDANLQAIAAGAARLQALRVIDRDSLAAFVQEDPRWVRVLGLAVGLSQEQLGIRLRGLFGTRSFVRVARRAGELVAALDELGLVKTIAADRGRSFGYGDVLAERYGSRATAGRAITRGRSLEDMVESIVRDLGLPFGMRTRFVGRANATAPCDLAIPAGLEAAGIVVGIKGFNSSGSVLTHARREIEEMAQIRRPNQVVLAVVDGAGWIDRNADLVTIHGLAERNEIDGLYTQASLEQFRVDVEQAARLRGIDPIWAGL